MKITLKKWLVFTLSLGLLSASPLVMAYGNDDDHDDDHDRHRLTVCERSANKMFHSCRNEIKEEYFAETAKCINFGDPGEREACFDEVREARAENRELCGAQREARSAVCELLMEDRYDPEALLDTQNFVEEPDDSNPYFSLKPGHTYVARAGTRQDFDEGIGETNVVTVTDQVREVHGVNCRLVVDIVLLKEEADDDFVAVEVTDDYYAQTVDGDVQYCGEVARNFEDGLLVNLDGSFEAGRDNARSGVLIRANPVRDDAHRQEYLLGEAEDVIRYIAGAARGTGVPGREGGENPAFPCNDECVKTEEFIPPEPDSGEYKYYIAGTGFVLGVALENGEPNGERDELVCTGEAADSSLARVLNRCGIDEPTRELLCEFSPVAFCD